jgi:hypothetical protein
MATATQQDSSVRFELTPEAATEATTHLTFDFQDESMAVEFVSAVKRQDGGEPRREDCRVSLPLKGVVRTFIETKNHKYIVEFKSPEAAKRWQEYSIISNQVSSSDIQLYIPRKWKKDAFEDRLRASSAPRSKMYVLGL